MSSNDEKVKAAYRAWEQSRDRLKAAERLLQDGVDRGPVGAAPPAQALEAVQALRRQTEDLLGAALLAITARAQERRTPGFDDSRN